MPQYILYNNNKFEDLNIILPGSSSGFQTGFINQIFCKFVELGQSTISFNYVFLDRAEDHSSGVDLEEELESLENIIQVVDIEKYKRINFIGKSLGAIVASKFLSANQKLQSKSTLSILGYVKGSIDLSKITCKTLIIQGELDRFGNMKEVRSDLENTDTKHVTFIEIPNANHSYKDKDDKPVFQSSAIDLLVQNLYTSH